MYVALTGINFINLDICFYMMIYSILSITMSLCGTFFIGFDRLLSVLFPIKFILIFLNFLFKFFKIFIALVSTKIHVYAFIFHLEFHQFIHFIYFGNVGKYVLQYLKRKLFNIFLNLFIHIFRQVICSLPDCYQKDAGQIVNFSNK